MLVNWAYIKRDNFFQRLDPRARIIFMLCCLTALGFLPGQGTGFWDIRVVLGFLAIALGQIIAAQITWKQMRRFWILITIIGVMLSLVTLFTGRGALDVYNTTQERIVWTQTINWFGSPVILALSAERLTFLVTQILRIITFAALSVVIPYTIDPALYGIAFRKLGLGDKVAYAMDLAFRFIPTLGRDMQIIMDAQRARGFELDTGRGSTIVQRVRNFAPLLIPLTIGAVLEGEEISDAMDLRSFGVGPRTWLPTLTYHAADFVFIALGLLILAGSIVVKSAGFGGLWIPPIF
jgi:energy-coupling factor transport system permease protein